MTAVDPHRLVGILQRSGFEVQGHTSHFARLGWPRPSMDRCSLVIPLDKTAPEYEELLGSALQVLIRTTCLGRTVEEALRQAGLLQLLEAEDW